MSDAPQGPAGPGEGPRDARTARNRSDVERGELVQPSGGRGGEEGGLGEAVEEPAKVMRIGSMVKQLLEETRTMELDEPSRQRLRDIYDMSVHEIGTAVSPDLREELDRLALPFTEAERPSEAELRVAKAQLVGWLEGLFHGIQATLFAQQMQARNQLEDMRRQLTAGGGGQGQPPGGEEQRPGTYL